MTDMTANTATVSTQQKKSRKSIPLMVIIGFIWIAAMILIALTADWIKPYNITAFDLKNRLALPGNAQHWLGTDELGRDVLSRLIESIRISLLIAFGATIISAVFGTTLGFRPPGRQHAKVTTAPSRQKMFFKQNFPKFSKFSKPLQSPRCSARRHERGFS